MSVIQTYNQFAGRHWETGSVANVLAFQFEGTDAALSEAMLLGISGGVAFGYFVFDYEGTDPHVSLLSRNTFDPLDTLFERLAIPQEIFHTADGGKAERNLSDVLEGGRPAIVWADFFQLPYNAMSPSDEMWAMLPIVVFGMEDGLVHIADRSLQPLTVSAEQLTIARGRIKKDKNRVLALGMPNLSRLPEAIEQGIRQCLALYKEPPPKGGRDSFGFAAYEKFVAMLTNTRNKQSWARLLPPGARMYAGLAGSGFQPGAFGWARTFPSNQVQDRLLYAQFLDEAAQVLNKPALKDVAEHFIESSDAWMKLSETLLPESVPMLDETRRLLLKKNEQFTTHGQDALQDIREISAQLSALRVKAEAEFPLPEEEAAEMRRVIAMRVRKVADIEREAITALDDAMA